MIIGITGGIGSGKSYVSDILKGKFGIPVYVCDDEAKRLAATDGEIRDRLTDVAGPEVFNGAELNRKYLADYIFSDLQHASKVNAIIHPAVLKDFRRWMKEQTAEVVCLESAILYESGFDEYVDKVLFVDAPEALRLQRAMLRDTATEEQIRARMKVQQPELHRPQADFVIDNGTDDSARLLGQLTDILSGMAPSRTFPESGIPLRRTPAEADKQ